MSKVQPQVVVRALAVGVPFILVGLLLPYRQTLILFAVLLGVAAGVYPGFAMLHPHHSSDVAMQWVAALVFTALGWLGVWWRPELIGAGWLLHAGWDLLHHRGAMRIQTPSTYPLLCLYADVQWGLFLLVLVWLTAY